MAKIASGKTTRALSSAARAIFALLPRLDANEIALLAARVQALRALAGGARMPAADDAGVDGETDWLTMGVEQLLRARGLLPARVGLLAMTTPRWRERPAHERRRIAAAHAALAQAAFEPLRRRLLPARPTASELAALARFAAECLADHVQGRMRPDGDGRWQPMRLSPRSMRRYIGEAAAAVQAAFPGYSPAMLRQICLAKEGPDDRTDTQPIRAAAGETVGGIDARRNHAGIGRARTGAAAAADAAIADRRQRRRRKAISS